jgi:hypothetical protein
MNGRVIRSCVILTCLLLASSAAHAAPRNVSPSISGTSSAVLLTEGPFAGLYEYTLAIQWDTRQLQSAPGSQITVDLNLLGCASACFSGTFAFDALAGTSGGSSCTAYYGGAFACEGNSLLGQSGPAVEFLDIADGCDTATAGSGTFRYYSLFGPGGEALPGNLFLRLGTGTTVNGNLLGDLPSCAGATAVEVATWGAIKALYE